MALSVKIEDKAGRKIAKLFSGKATRNALRDAITEEELRAEIAAAVRGELNSEEDSRGEWSAT